MMSKLVYIASPFSKIWDKEFAVLLAEKALKFAKSFDEFKAFCLEDCDDE